jgi:hypothetical protein
MLTRRVSHSLVILLLVASAACSLNTRVRLAIANREFSASLVRIQQFVQSEYDFKRINDAELRAWKARLGRIADGGIALTHAINAGNSNDIYTQINALLTLLDELIAEDVVRLPKDSQLAVTIIIESARTTLTILSIGA